MSSNDMLNVGSKSHPMRISPRNMPEEYLSRVKEEIICVTLFGLRLKLTTVDWIDDYAFLNRVPLSVTSLSLK